MAIELRDVAQLLHEKDHILILTHQNPDGDTLGSGAALYYALRKKGKRACLICSDVFPQKFCYLFQEFEEDEFEPDFIVAVDIADTKLLGKRLSGYADQIDLSIDHHVSNKLFAKVNFVDSTAAATCEIMYQLLREMDADISKLIANCLYTGISTDTGCFKFSNTTAKTHRVAAELFECGADYESINRELFDTKSRARLAVEKYALKTMEYHFEAKVAITVISQEIIKSTEIDASELDGVSAIPRQIEGVEVGITMRERPEGGYKVSVRTCRFVDASKICAKLGGGGHIRAAGCAVSLPEEDAKEKLLAAIRPYFESGESQAG